MKKFETWKDIRDWAVENGYHKMARRMELNNTCWNSSGEFGRNQVEICDLMRFAETEAQRHKIATEINDACQDNLGVY